MTDILLRYSFALSAKFEFICEIQAWHAVPGFVVYIKRHLPSSPFFESQRRQQSIATRRQDFKDCKQILEDSLTPPLHIKARARLQPAQLSEDLP